MRFSRFRFFLDQLSRATDVARRMVKEYGMSEKLGHVYFADERRPAFIETGRDSGSDYKEATAKLIDSQAREIIGRQYAKALKILSKKKPVLMEGARLLLEKKRSKETI